MESRAGPNSCAYSSWAQVAGYFDGDGSIVIRKLSRGKPFTLNIALELVDQSKMQMAMIRDFLVSEGIKPGKLAFRSRAWRVEVGTEEGVLRMLGNMIPFLCKKATEAGAAVDYLNDKITGNEFQDTLGEAVKAGNRERVGVRVNLPWVKSEGLKRASIYVASLAGRKSTLSETEQMGLVVDHESGLSQRELAKTRSLSRDMVRRALARGGLAIPH